MGRRFRGAWWGFRGAALAAALAAPLALSCCAAGDTGICKLALATRLPYRATYGHIYVDATINGSKANLLFDTGSEFTTLTSGAIRRLGLSDDVLGGTMTGIGGNRRVSRTVTNKMELGRLHGAHFDLLVSDMNMEPTVPPTDGILGMDFLYNYDIDLDWPGGGILLYRKVQGCTRPAAALGQPLYALGLLPPDVDHPSLRFPVYIGHQAFNAELDTGAVNTVLFRRAASRLGLTRQVLAADRHVHIGGVGPRRVKAAEHVLEPMTLGDLTLKNSRVTVADQNFGDVDMLVGLPFTTKVHVWISNSSHTLILQYPPAASPNP